MIHSVAILSPESRKSISWPWL